MRIGRRTKISTIIFSERKNNKKLITVGAQTPSASPAARQLPAGELKKFDQNFKLSANLYIAIFSFPSL